MPSDDDDQRAGRRQPTVRNAVLTFGTLQRSCSVRDISAGGARVIMRDTTEVPRSVQLTLTADRLVYNAIVVRRTSTTLGVSFESGPFAMPERTEAPMQHFQEQRRR